MSKMKDLALEVEEYERRMAAEKERAKKREYKQEEAEEKAEEQIEFDFERDCGARP